MLAWAHLSLPDADLGSSNGFEGVSDSHQQYSISVSYAALKRP
jgi:hypothetical protein